jgi:hypothetical protein
MELTIPAQMRAGMRVMDKMGLRQMKVVINTSTMVKKKWSFAFDRGAT